MTQADDYAMTVLPGDVDDTGMMTVERYGRHGDFALRKFWLRNGVAKCLEGPRGGGFSVRVVARHTNLAGACGDAALGLFSAATIKTCVAFVDDATSSLFLEQRFLSSSPGGGEFQVPKLAALSLVQVAVVPPQYRGSKRRLPRGVDTLSAVLVHVLTRATPKKRANDKVLAENRAVKTDVAVLSDDRLLKSNCALAHFYQACTAATAAAATTTTKTATALRPRQTSTAAKGAEYGGRDAAAESNRRHHDGGSSKSAETTSTDAGVFSKPTAVATSTTDAAAAAAAAANSSEKDPVERARTEKIIGAIMKAMQETKQGVEEARKVAKDQ